MEQQEHSSRGGCLKGCGFGCLGLAVVVVALGVVTSRVVVQPFSEAIEARAALDERFGSQEEFTPPVDGGLAEERVRAFLTVREALQPVCDELASVAAAMAEMDAFDEMEEEPSKVVVMGQALETTQAAFRIAPLMGRFFEVRNSALVHAEMGLGEYTWIYLLAYGDRFAASREDDLFGDRPMNRRVRELVIDMLRRQLGTAMSEGLSRPVLEAEIAALEADRDRVAWAEGPPPEGGAALAPFRDALDDLWCDSTAGLELLRNRRSSFAVEAE